MGTKESDAGPQQLEAALGVAPIPTWVHALRDFKAKLQGVVAVQATDSYLWAEATGAEVRVALRELHALIEEDEEALTQIQQLKASQLTARLRKGEASGV
jgi:hypothetical protein